MALFPQYFLLIMANQYLFLNLLLIFSLYYLFSYLSAHSYSMYNSQELILSIYSFILHFTSNLIINQWTLLASQSNPSSLHMFDLIYLLNCLGFISKNPFFLSLMYFFHQLYLKIVQFEKGLTLSFQLIYLKFQTYLKYFQLYLLDFKLLFQCFRFSVYLFLENLKTLLMKFLFSLIFNVVCFDFVYFVIFQVNLIYFWLVKKFGIYQNSQTFDLKQFKHLFLFLFFLYLSLK